MRKEKEKKTIVGWQGCQMVRFQTKIPIWENFGGPWIRKSLYILGPLGIFCGD
jgi:hypothetical protein